MKSPRVNIHTTECQTCGKYTMHYFHAGFWICAEHTGFYSVCGNRLVDQKSNTVVSKRHGAESRRDGR